MKLQTLSSCARGKKMTLSTYEVLQWAYTCSRAWASQIDLAGACKRLDMATCTVQPERLSQRPVPRFGLRGFSQMYARSGVLKKGRWDHTHFVNQLWQLEQEETDSVENHMTVEYSSQPGGPQGYGGSTAEVTRDVRLCCGC